MASRLGNLRLYKLDVPYHSNVGVIVVTQEDEETGSRFRLTRYTGKTHRGSKAGLSQSFIDLLDRFFFNKKDSNITNQILTYLVANFSFKDLKVVPPACVVLVFHFHIRELHHEGPAPQIDITEAVMDELRIDDTVLDIDDVGYGLVPIAPNTTEIADCYRGQELCCLCEKVYPKEEEIIYKTVCNHIFHATCISSHLLRIPQRPVCSTELLPVDIRALLFRK